MFKFFKCLDSQKSNKITKNMFNMVCIFMFFLICLSCVSAQDINTNNTLNSDDGFEDLDDEIKNLTPGDVYSLDKDYDLNGEHTIYINTDNITIDGNGHLINANNHTGSIFNILGNNVVIKNLNIIGANYAQYILDQEKMLTSDNPYYRDFNSPICWYGNNGVIDECYFLNNYGVNGGVISWYGNSGTIENTRFVNSTALGAGAALYNSGENNTFTNTTFINSRSCFVNEDVFTDKEMKLSNESAYYVIDNSEFGFDVNNLKYVYPVNLVDTKFNIIPIIYGTLMDIVSFEIVENTECLLIYNITDLTLMIDHYIGNNDNFVTFSLSYTFTNLTNNTNEFITKLKNQEYDNTMMLTETMHVYDIASYKDAQSTSAVNVINKDMIKACFEIFDKNNAATAYTMSSTNAGKSVCLAKLREYGVSFDYNVVFDGKYTFKNHDTWDIDALGYDVVSIDGNGSTITGSADERDEYKWALISANNMVYLNNITIKKFNNALINFGVVVLDNVVFDSNKMDYRIDRDWGAAILNAGYCVCNNCSFINNYACKGGAIFTQHELYLNNCTFSKNTGYDLGNDVLNADEGNVYINGEKITVGDKKTKGVITYAESISLDAVTVASVVSALVMGVITGSIIGGPWGMVAGIVVGAIMGLYGSYVAASNTYDINFDRKAYTLSLVGLCVQAGMVGATIGSIINEYVSHLQICHDGNHWYYYYEYNNGELSKELVRINHIETW